MKKFIILLLPLLFASCYKEVDITTLDISSTVEPAYTTANVSAESNIASSNLNLRIHLATNSDMDQNLQTIELGDAKEGYCQKVISNLTDGTTYYYQLEGYSNSTQKQFDIGSFTTLKAEPPTVTTTQPTNITNTTATSGGAITFDGGIPVSARGVCWSTNANPTISNSHTNNGTGTGSFTSYLTNLIIGTTYYVRAYATNAKGTSYGEQKTFTTSASKPTVTTTAVSNITSSSATSGGNVTSTGGDNVTARGVCWSTSNYPTISNSHTTNGTGSGNFTSSITGLSAGTKYYVRAYATNSAGTSYGSQVSFTTSVNLPTVTTAAVSDITETTATCGGNVTSTGEGTITAKGVCWSTSANPTLANSRTTNGAGGGSFTSNITGLTPNTTYYVRAYATNNAGTAYGSQVSFTTSAELPTVTTTTVSNITSSTATSGGNVTATGGANVTARGVCWSTSTNPTINNSHTTNGTGAGSFSSNITGLSPNTTYHVRAYATNSAGTAYGSQMTFTTSTPPPSYQDFTVGGYTFRMKHVEGGTFNMGAQSSNPSGANYDPDIQSDESPVHSVTLSGFYIGETEVTQGLWNAVMGVNVGHDAWSSGQGSNYPAYAINYNDVQTFITQLNSLTGLNFRMPTEAEWEYAARGGNQSQGYKYSGSNNIDNVAWHYGNSSTTHPVKGKSPNELGLYDMSGNVDEWCSDWYGSYGSSSQTNPTGPTSGSYRIFRGGWFLDTGSCRVSWRGNAEPTYLGLGGIGLRLALSE